MFHQNKNSMSSIIGSDLELTGDIDIKGDLLIYGVINGNINCEGMVTTAKESKIKITSTDLDIIYFEQIIPQEIKKEAKKETQAQE